MLVPYFDSSISREDDIMNSITDDEREKMKEIESMRQVRTIYYSAAAGPSIVLDDFLFLGNMQNATDRELLERFQISTIFNSSFLLILFYLRTYFKCMRLGYRKNYPR
jgi:hypothetical protein